MLASFRATRRPAGSCYGNFEDLGADAVHHRQEVVPSGYASFLGPFATFRTCNGGAMAADLRAYYALSPDDAVLRHRPPKATKTLNLRTDSGSEIVVGDYREIIANTPWGSRRTCLAQRKGPRRRGVGLLRYANESSEGGVAMTLRRASFRLLVLACVNGCDQAERRSLQSTHPTRRACR